MNQMEKIQKGNPHNNCYKSKTEQNVNKLQNQNSYPEETGNGGAIQERGGVSNLNALWKNPTVFRSFDKLSGKHMYVNRPRW